MARFELRHRLFTLSLLAFVVIATIVPSVAEAGCLREHDTCVSCARGRLKKALLRLDFRGVRDANIDLWDCSIDAWHCVMLGEHHTYSCAL